MATDNQSLPLDWYGRYNYLGKPVNVGVQGETPVGGNQAGMAAIASSGAGPTASTSPGTSMTGSPAASASKGVPGASGNTALNEAMQDLGYAGMGATALSEGPKVADFLSRNPVSGSQDVSAAQQGMKVGEDIGEKSLAEDAANAAAKGAQGGAEAGSDLTLSGSLGPVGLAAMLGQGINMGGQYASNALFKNDPHVNEAAQTAIDLSNPASALAEGISGLTDLFTGNIKGFMNEAPIKFAADTLHNPVGMVKDLWNGLFGAPPAFALPQSVSANIAKQVSGSLPKPLEMPKNATPEQTAAINKANSMIAELSPYGSAPNAQGIYAPPPNLPHMNESAQAWEQGINSTMGWLNQKFNALSPAYQEAVRLMTPVSKDFYAAQPVPQNKQAVNMSNEPKAQTLKKEPAPSSSLGGFIGSKDREKIKEEQ